ncbi:MAG: phosphoribosylanthranilate isomerase [Erythrobacter sp.]|uniref:phosphoribosylanthranilate isomerase n=1 Tax=Erythrobacter sp. TaxID=1042 RepID=UPI00262CC53F|nr:phosphoribosylanthranilate isomerase [Erythrobacter sp.]MDJ0977997.1 phosphoribosylanthranilate isomerase [Erythrobacter sp.]
MPMQIKICGVSTPEAIAAAAEAGATHIGLVHFAKSPRHVDLERAAALRRAVPESVKMVVLVVNPGGLTLANIAETLRPDVIQFHGSEPPEALFAVKKRFGIEVWKALPAHSRASLDESAIYDGLADRLLFDAPAPEGSALPGGRGEAFDWAILKDYPHRSPWALAGGLTPGNVALAIRATGADFLDVSSGVESAPGVKDVDKIAAFCKAALNA